MQPSDVFLERIPERFRAGACRMAHILSSMEKVVVAAHVNPDGDALGAMAAAAHILRGLGKQYLLYAWPGLPANLDFFILPDAVHTTLEDAPFVPEAALLLDCGEPGRLGRELADLLPTLPSLNIDHHPGSGMGSLGSWVEAEAAASAQLMGYVALACGIPLAGGLAEAVGLGIITDTDGFRHGNTDAAVLRLAADLAEGGCRLSRIRDQLESVWSIPRLRLWACLGGRAELRRRGTVAFCAVFQEDLRATGAVREDTEGFADQLRRIRGVRMAVLLREESSAVCKFSLRSYGRVDARAAAAVLGGGGHRNAAGGTLHMGMDEAARALLEAVEAELDAEDRAGDGTSF